MLHNNFNHLLYISTTTSTIFFTHL
jgi:hypothetical protein